MKRFLLLMAVFLMVSLSVHAEVYRIFISLEDSNLYKDQISNLYIHTRYCYEYVYGQEAVLYYEPYSYGNKIVFKDGNMCPVAEVLKSL
jgi:hypothetical protein